MRFTFFFLFLLLFSHLSVAREFEVTVSVNFQKLTNEADRQVLSGLEQTVRSYLEEFQWTLDPTFNPDTKIQLSLNLILETSSQNRTFTGQLFIAASRKAFGSGKPTSLLRYTDKLVEFDYFSGYQPQHTEQVFEKLASLLDFYAYLVLGLDADSYDPQAGQLYFARAQRIASLPGISGTIGWLPSTTSSDNRKLIADEFVDPKYSNFRNGFFKYHYDGLDAVVLDAEKASQGIYEGLSLIADTNKKYPNSVWRRLFFDAKYKEISEFFADAQPDRKQDVYRLLQLADPSHLTEYENLR